MLDDISQQIHGLEDELRKCQEQITGVEVRNEQMIIVVDEFERTVQGIIKEKDKENVPLLIQKEKVARERDLVVSDLENVERAFSDLNNKYERAVGVVSSFAEEEEQLKSTLEDLTTRLSASVEKYETKKKDAEKQLQEASERLSSKQSAGDREIARLKAQIRKAEMNVSSMEEKIKQKSSENQELTNLCDDLVSKLDAIAKSGTA